jgi:hypothetical protein
MQQVLDKQIPSDLYVVSNDEPIDIMEAVVDDQQQDARVGIASLQW